MKKRRHRELGRYLRACADALELRDWTVSVDVGSPEVDGDRMVAVVEMAQGRKCATMTVAPDFDQLDCEEIRQTVAHELVHVHLEPMWAQLREDLLHPLGQGAYDVFMAAARRNMEYGVDALADALAPGLPLIEWPD